ncbi:broad specificity phosphatase PhoE [Motilibacter peucedani]|uniref:Broad specificity phosphatase PhoE n=1 Tax=Motilibacter peucedani TaxID=598650 RepID=A0A420XL57_9ACTN|nr:histidine phosphatase family protein [Motilibacter peucedani]RKS69165.1 broad specificity phosphatase PhoE [Motilibacter peucedani]
MPETTRVHVVRHGEVHNPEGVLYGRLPGFRLSELGLQMAERLGEVLGRREITHIVSSPLERAQQTAAPLAATLGLEVAVDPRVIEAGNRFEGKTFGVGDGSLRRPAIWPLLVNPFRPSWGEPYVEIAARMRAAVADVRAAVRGGEAVIVSHQLPVWTMRRSYEGRRLWHDPRNRQCSLASVTTLVWTGDRLTAIDYTEPAGDLLPVKAGFGA